VASGQSTLRGVEVKEIATDRARAFGDASIAPASGPETVRPMPTDLGQLRRRQSTMARLEGMEPHAQGATATGPVALEVVRRIAAPPVALDAGAAVRLVDDKGRVKPGFSRPLHDLLAWAEGDLACQLDGPWLVLTQPPALRGARRTRYSTRGHLRCVGNGRLHLSPAQVHAVVGPDRQVFLVPVPAAGALVVAHPGAFLAGAPPSVARLFSGSEPTVICKVGVGSPADRG